MASTNQNSHMRSHYNWGGINVCQHTPPSGGIGYEHAGVLNCGSPHLMKTCIPICCLQNQADGCLIQMEAIPLIGRIQRFRRRSKAQLTSLSRGVPARRDVIPTDVSAIRKEPIVVLDVNARGASTYLWICQRNLPPIITSDSEEDSSSSCDTDSEEEDEEAEDLETEVITMEELIFDQQDIV